MLHVGARLHAFVHGLFRPSDYALTHELYTKVKAQFDGYSLCTSDGQDRLADALADAVLEACGLSNDHPQRGTVINLIERLCEYEGFFQLPRIDWSDRHTITEYWQIRDALNIQRELVEDFAGTFDRIVWLASCCLDSLYAACPQLLETEVSSNDITVPTDLIRSIGGIDAVAESMIKTVFDEELENASLFQRHRERFKYNLIAASGGNPEDPDAWKRAVKYPSKSGITDPSELIDTYLGGTPLAALFRGQIDFVIPTATRWEHHHLVAGSGHGKTQTLQYLIARDLEAVARGERSVVVLDSQGDLIGNIGRLAEFAPGGPLHDRIVIIDPTDVEWPVSLNLFDVGIERLQGYAPLERERLINSILELYDFVIGSLLSAELTQKQNVILRYVMRLMLHIPDATIHTLRDLMEPDSHVKFAPHIAKLTGSARHFFETEFRSGEFDQTKKQVLRRLWGILENQTFERMFSHPRSKLDLFTEMNAGKVILINTAKDLLKQTGCGIFGRFFIALIAQAVQERATIPADRRMSTLLYVDEFQDYVSGGDATISTILEQLRKYKLGTVWSHQYLGQLDNRLEQSLAANTSIKFAGGVSTKDAKTLAPMLHCDSSFVESQLKGHFAAYLRGVTKSAVPLSFPFGYLEHKPQMTTEERDALRDVMRARYAVHYSELEAKNEAEDTDEQDDDGKPPEDDTRRPEGPDLDNPDV